MILLEARDLSAGWRGVPVVRGLDLHVSEGELVALLGPNGAGKTTTVLTLSGVLPALGGTVAWLGRETKAPLHVRAKGGLGLVTEQRCVLSRLTVAENLRLGRGPHEVALELFPELEPLLDRRVGLLSGGQQQILAVARVLAAQPKVIIADELSLGLAPQVVDRLLRSLRAAANKGAGVLLVEQHVRVALRTVDRAYVLRRGVVEHQGSATELLGRLDQLEDSYLAAAPAGTGTEPS